MENVILNNIQHIIDQKRREYAHQYENPTTSEDSDSNPDEVLEEQTGMAPNDNGEDTRALQCSAWQTSLRSKLPQMHMRSFLHDKTCRFYSNVSQS